MHSPSLLLVALAATSALAQTRTITLDAVSQISDGQPQAPTGPPVPAMSSISFSEMLSTSSSHMFMTTWTSMPAPTTSQPLVVMSQSSVPSWSYSSGWNNTTAMTMSTATTATMNIGISSGYTPSSTSMTVVPTTMAPSMTTAAAVSASASGFTNGAALNRVASAAGGLVVLGSFFALL